MGDQGNPESHLSNVPSKSASPTDVPNLSPAGSQLVSDLSQRHGVSTDAATHMLLAVYHGNGSMAQFSHPEFGGSGQWMRGGMTMVSDLFNNQLKCKVDNICSDISNELANHQQTPFSGSFQSQSQSGSHNQAQASGGQGAVGSPNSLFVADPVSQWWPAELGNPTAIGSQNSVRYAYFAPIRRLAVTTGGTAWVYDTLDHQIGGFSQQQGGGSSITFSSQYGTVDLSTLPVVSRDGVPQGSAASGPSNSQGQSVSQGQFGAPPQPEPAAPSSTGDTGDNGARQCDSAGPSATAPATSGTVDKDDVIGTLERLGDLVEKGYLSEEEFATKKAELLSRL